MTFTEMSSMNEMSLDELSPKLYQLSKWCNSD